MKLCIALLLATVQAQVQSNGQHKNDVASKLHFVGNYEHDSYLPTQNTPQYVIEKSNDALSSNSVGQPSSNLQPPGLGNGHSYYNSFERNPGVQERYSLSDDVYSTPTVSGINASSLAVTKFAVSLFKTIEDDRRDSNIVASPFSIAILLALLQQGALGGTQQQISAALGIRPDDAADAFKKYIEDISRRSSRNILKMANIMFLADSFVLNSLFRRVAVQSFGSDVTPAKFSRSQEAVQNINAWVADKTNNNIENILAPDAVDQNTQLVLVNTVYFKGIWQVKFKAEQTIQRAFHSGDGRSKMVPMMRQHMMLKTGVGRNNAQVVFLPFEGDQYSLLVVLPSKMSSLRELVSNLSEDQLQEYLNFTPKEVTLELPKFTVRADTDLIPPLRKLGITNIFSSTSALSGLGMFENYSPQVSSAVHSAMLAIDEQGGTAAAATAFAAVALSYDDSGISFKVHRPFLAVLWDHRNGLPLFMACIYDPTA